MRRARLRLLSRSLLFLPASRHPAADSGFPSVTLMLATVLPAPGIAAVMPNGAIARKSSTDYPDKAPASSCGDSGLGQLLRSCARQGASASPQKAVVPSVAMHKVAALQPAARGKRREAGSQLRGRP